MDGIVKVWGGSYWDYWFTENEILRVSLVSQTVVIVAILLMATLGFLLGLIGITIGVVVLVLVYARVRRTAKKRRSQLEGRSIDDLVGSKMIGLRIPYSDVSHAELGSGQISIFYRRRRIRMKVPPGDLPQLDTLLRSKLGDKLTVSTG